MEKFLPTGENLCRRTRASRVAFLEKMFSVEGGGHSSVSRRRFSGAVGHDFGENPSDARGACGWGGVP